MKQTLCQSCQTPIKVMIVDTDSWRLGELGFRKEAPYMVRLQVLACGLCRQVWYWEPSPGIPEWMNTGKWELHK